jgi:dihydropteroate synthase
MLSINCKGKLLTFSTPVVMGIINITPNSFYSGSRHEQIDKLLVKAEQMWQQGATIIDIGGQSTRPGSERITADEELKRVVPALESLIKKFPDHLFSIDTFYSKVAKEAIDAGVSIVNDISAGSIDPELISTVAALQVPYVLMHMQGHPQTMQQSPVYKNVVLDVFDFLNFKSEELHKAGINDIIIDLGFGFGKTTAHNLQLLAHLSYFEQLKKPLLIGLSRKATIYKTLQVTAEEALNGTTVLHTVGLLNGVQILRVHDVKEAVEAIKLVGIYKKEKEQN